MFGFLTSVKDPIQQVLVHQTEPQDFVKAVGQFNLTLECRDRNLLLVITHGRLNDDRLHLHRSSFLLICGCSLDLVKLLHVCLEDTISVLSETLKQGLPHILLL